ncbi:permease prefix domain 1-containing protein [Candidatus Aminicenantes bacterium AH-873-B07]|nr:permease prefix domain 1-containing protein [Candidatus Aminicenantes bacterium AH-873-B07]
MDLIQKYLDSISKKLRLNRKKEEEIIKEIKTHLEYLILEYKKGGISVKKAEQRAIEKFGNPKKLLGSFSGFMDLAHFQIVKLKMLS